MKNYTCTVCQCPVTLPFKNPLGNGEITCWYHADMFYVAHPKAFINGQRRYADIPNLPLDKS